MGFLDKLQHRYELYKLEQRYTKRHRRTTFISEATYVDGEYVYGHEQPTSPTGSFSSQTTKSSTNSKRRSMYGSWGISSGGRN
ncbi:hypothetical protein BJ508DRAFT_328555 [Ascobolus immersus RN42]|uniref:Uncharacterized protein n=1 Tax=Ascobolus immersus RN42 TaxID=1160509 RepID=A0A3N4HZ47_ASCIM|nr:hypothetical protein BJ508DRAFT_328555 [Ascobolus immersus RN42]